MRLRGYISPNGQVKALFPDKTQQKQKLEITVSIYPNFRPEGKD